eukprot:COSAG06_NODE_5553_length_3405_cov_22.186933_2_plen_53_part_00
MVVAVVMKATVMSMLVITRDDGESGCDLFNNDKGKYNQFETVLLRLHLHLAC